MNIYLKSLLISSILFGGIISYNLYTDNIRQEQIQKEEEAKAERLRQEQIQKEKEAKAERLRQEQIQKEKEAKAERLRQEQIQKENLLKNKLNYQKVTQEDKKELDIAFTNTIQEIYSDNNINIFLSNNIKSPIKKDRLNKMVSNIKKTVNTGTVIIYEDETNNINIYVVSHRVSIKKDTINSTENTMKNKKETITYIIVKDHKGNFTIEIYNPKDSLNQDNVLNPNNISNSISFRSNNIFHFPFNKTNIVKTENILEYIKYLEFAKSEFGDDLNEITIVGHTDSIGSKDYNMLLSYKRAQSLNKYLKKYNIKLRYIGKGESSPIASNKTKEGRALNRRIELYLGVK